MPEQPIEKKFWSHVEKRDGCWLWAGCKMSNGYGDFRVMRDGKYRHVSPHRLSYELHHGPIPTGLNVCHSCDTPSCVNPNHLFAGTQAQNRRDCVAKNRQARGERHGMSKLTENQVKLIREQRTSGLSLRKIASRFAVSDTLVMKICRGDLWEHRTYK